MRLYRIGDKVVSREKLLEVVDAILADREGGATQEEASGRAGVQRSFVSILESVGEVRRGPKVALVAFPVANAEEVRLLAEDRALDLVLVLSQAEREDLESGSAREIFNRVLEILAQLRDFDVIVLIASDWRIRLVERILGREVIGIVLGSSPLRSDVTVDTGELASILEAVTAPGPQLTQDPGRWDRSNA